MTTPVTTTSNARIIWLSITAVILAGVVLLMDPFQSQPQVTPTRTGASDPDLELEGAIITQFRKSGALKYRLESPRIRRFERELRTELELPDLVLHNDPDPPWHISAIRGLIRNRKNSAGSLEEEVYLEEHVVLTQDHPDGRRFRLDSPSLTLYPDRQYAETARDVIVDTHAGRTIAVGLKGDLEKGLFHLFSDVDQRVHTILQRDQFK